MYAKYIKRSLDVVIAIFGLVVASPLLLIISILIKLDSPGPVFFFQTRIGLRGQVFSIVKFRTMCVGAEHTGSGVYSEKDDMRVTKVGRILRMLSLDELPQLFCLLAGTMSLIGPRPPLTYHPWPYENYSEEQKKMFSVRPGITGWSQVNGRNTVEWPRRIQLNVWYAEHLTFMLDVKIFFMTIYKVLGRKDVLITGITIKGTENNEASSEVSK